MPEEENNPKEEAEAVAKKMVMDQAKKAVWSAIAPYILPVIGVVVAIIIGIAILIFLLGLLGGIFSHLKLLGFGSAGPDGINGGGGGATGTGDLTCPTNLNPETAGECLDEYIKDNVPSSPMIGQGKTFVQAGQQYNVNPALMAAIGHHESSFGTLPASTSNIGHPLYYNYFGMTCSNSTQRLYSTNQINSCYNSSDPADPSVHYYLTLANWNEAINEQAAYLKIKYLDAGRNTIEKIGQVYCPVSLNEWVGDVSAKFSSIIGKCPEFGSSLGGGTATTPGTNIQKLLDYAQNHEWRQLDSGGCWNANEALYNHVFSAQNEVGWTEGGDANSTTSPPTQTDLQKLRQNLNEDHIVIWHIRGEGSGQHWIILTSIDAANNISYLDPNGGLYVQNRPYNFESTTTRLGEGYFFARTPLGPQEYWRGVIFRPPES